MRKISICFIAVLLLSGCSASPKSKVAIMHNPETKDTKECKIDPWATWQWEYEKVLGQYIHGYEATGYQRVDK